MPLALPTLRRRLHQQAEPAGHEEATARIVAGQLGAMGVDIVADDVGGHGILARVGAGRPALLLRCDMDALPMREESGVEHAAPANHHACGHDGHMAMLLGAIADLRDRAEGTLWFLFQPAEETGHGMAECLRHPAMPQELDHVIGMHNVPGHQLGSILLHAGTACVASTGMVVHLTGATSHAAEPEKGRNPIPAAARLVPVIEAAARHGDDEAVAALVHIRGGGPRFGTSAGDALVGATLRAGSDEALARMVDAVESAARAEAHAGGFDVRIELIEPFPATINSSSAVERVSQALRNDGVVVVDPGVFPWSEDFGHAAARWPGVFMGIGSGTDQPALHTAAYDFPDDLLEHGVRAWRVAVEALS